MTVAPIADPQTDKRGNVVSFIILVCFLNSFYLFSCVRAKCYTGLFSDCPGPRFATRTCSHHPPWRQVHRPHIPNNRWISRSWMSPKHLSSLLSFCKFLKPDWRTRSIRAAVLLRQLDYFFENPKFTEGEKIGAPLFLKMNIQWICEAFYEDIPKELIVKVSLKCGTCNHSKLSQHL